MRFIVHPEVKTRAPEALGWVKEFLARFDTSLLGWLRIDFGREHRDRQGRIYYRFQGVYGRCWYPTKKQPSIRLSCQVPGPFPCEIITRKKPIYRNSDGTWPAEAKQNRGPVYCDGPRTRRRIGRRAITTGLSWLASEMTVVPAFALWSRRSEFTADRAGPT